MPRNLNTLITIIAAVVAAIAAFYTWQMGTQEKLFELQSSVERNSANITAIEKNFARDLAKAVEEKVASVVPTAVKKEISLAIPSTIREFHYLGTASCGSSSTFSVPDPNTTTDNWIVLGIDPQISAEFENDKVFNNALLGFRTEVKSKADSKAWEVDFIVRTNLATSSKHKDIAVCNRSTSSSGKVLSGPPSKIHFVAFRKPNE